MLRRIWLANQSKKAEDWSEKRWNVVLRCGTIGRMPMTPAQRQERARKAVQTRWAKTKDRSAATAKPRAAFLQTFVDQVDPDRVLPEDVREQYVEAARRDYYRQLRRTRDIRAAQRAAVQAALAAAETGDAAS